VRIIPVSLFHQETFTEEMNMKRKIVIPIVVSSVVLMLSAIVVVTQGTHAAENILQTHAADEIVETGGAQ
jgi:flagellar basal body-associated protein FliL